MRNLSRLYFETQSLTELKKCFFKFISQSECLWLGEDYYAVPVVFRIGLCIAAIGFVIEA